MCLFVSQSCPLVFVQRFDLLELGRVLSDKGTLLQNIKNICQTFLVCEFLNISQQSSLGNISQRIGDSGDDVKPLARHKNWGGGDLLGVEILVQVDRGQGATAAAVNVVVVWSLGDLLIFGLLADAWVCHDEASGVQARQTVHRTTNTADTTNEPACTGRRCN